MRLGGRSLALLARKVRKAKVLRNENMADDASNCKEGNLCAACKGTNDLKLCSRCRNVFYCSREHQVAHWEIHRRTCRKVARTTNGRAPDTTAGDGYSTGLDMSSASDSGVESGSPNVNQSNSPPPDSEELMRAFDHRDLRLQNFPRPNSTRIPQLSKYVAKALKCDGYCVLDGIVSESLCDEVLREVLTLERAGALKPGQLAGDNVVNRSIRSDNIMWFEGTERRYPSICKLLTKFMDSIVGGLNAHLGSEHMIKGKTKVSCACDWCGVHREVHCFSGINIIVCPCDTTRTCVRACAHNCHSV